MAFSPIPKMFYQVWHDKIPLRTDINQHGKYLSPPLGHAKNIYDSIFVFIIPITTKLNRMIYKHKLSLLRR